MKIQSSVRVAKVLPSVARQMDSFIDDEKHELAWTPPEILSPSSAVTAHLLKVNPDYQLQAASLEEIDEKSEDPDERLKKMRKAYLKMATNSTALIRHQFPALSAPVEGMELVFASYNAFDAWTDPERSGWFAPSLSTARAVMEAIEVFAPIVPGLTEVKDYTKTAGMIIKTLDGFYQVYQAHQ